MCYTEKAFRRRNPPRRFLSLKQAKRYRALQEPLTPETVDQVVERNWAVDRADTMQRMSNIDEDGGGSSQIFKEKTC